MYERASQSLFLLPNLFSLPASEMKSAATKDVSVLSHVPASGLGGCRAIAELRLAPRTTVALSRAAVSKYFISACTHQRRRRDLPMRRTAHPCLASLTANATASVNRTISCRHARSGAASTRRFWHSSRCRIISLH